MSPEPLWIQQGPSGISGLAVRVAQTVVAGGIPVEELPAPRARSTCGICFFEDDELQFLESVRRWQEASPQIRLLAILARAAPSETGVRRHMLSAGVEDVIAWSESDSAPDAIFARVRRWRAVEEALAESNEAGLIVGAGERLRRTVRHAAEVARFGQGPVLITGESGTGKELFARLVHALDGRPNKRNYVICDCTTLVPDLAGSELFGHERGAFTNAVESRDGAIPLADRGTLFLDEIGELPLRLQAELLRVLQEGTYKRIGSNTWRHSQFRLICATNRDLKREMAEGRFRADLYYRIAASRIHIDGLAQRKEDIPALAGHFTSEFLGTPNPPPLEADLEQFLRQRDYPGNVRELRQLIVDLLSRYAGVGPLTLSMLSKDELQHLPLPGSGQTQWEEAVQGAILSGRSLAEIKDSAISAAYRLVLRATDNNTELAASRLRVTRRAVQQFLQRNLAPDL